MEGKGTAVREGGLLAPGDAGADGDGADRRAGVRPAGPGDHPATRNPWPYPYSTNLAMAKGELGAYTSPAYLFAARVAAWG